MNRVEVEGKISQRDIARTSQPSGSAYRRPSGTFGQPEESDELRKICLCIYAPALSRAGPLFAQLRIPGRRAPQADAKISGTQRVWGDMSTGKRFVGSAGFNV